MRFTEPSIALSMVHSESAGTRQIRTSLATTAAIAFTPAVLDSDGRVRERMRLHVAEYARSLRQDGATPESMLVEFKALVGEMTAPLPPQERVKVSEELIAWAIEDYYSGR